MHPKIFLWTKEALFQTSFPRPLKARDAQPNEERQSAFYAASHSLLEYIYFL